MPPSGVVLTPCTSLPSRPGMQKCAFFLRTGSCKFGETCRYDHPTEEAATAAGQSEGHRATERPNGRDESTDLPIRPGVQECSFFMKTGVCKYGETCRWHHPPEKQADMGRAAYARLSMSQATIPAMPGMHTMPDPMALMGAMIGLGAMGGVGGMLAARAGNITGMPPAPMGGAEVWQTHWSDSGRPYYYNLFTLQSQWEPPQEMVMQQARTGLMAAPKAQHMSMSMSMPTFGAAPAVATIVNSSGAHPVRKFSSLTPYGLGQFWSLAVTSAPRHVPVGVACAALYSLAASIAFRSLAAVC